MPTTMKQKEARKSRGLEIVSDFENLDTMLGENHFNGTERDESLNSTSIRGHESVASNNLENEGESSYSNHRNTNVRTNADYGQHSVDMSSQAEINNLSSELNSRISRKMDKMMNSISVQIQRAINDAISNQVLHQIQNAILAGSGRVTRKGWDVPAERPEMNAEVQRNLNTRNNPRNEQDEGHQNGDLPSHNVHDMMTGENESPNPVPEFLRNHLNQSYEDINLDPSTRENRHGVDADPISRLADVLTNMQNRPTAQQLTIRPVNSNTMTFDGKSEKFELFEDLFHTMIKMQPEITE